MIEFVKEENKKVQVIPTGELEIAQEVTALKRSERLAEPMAVLAQLDAIAPKIRIKTDEDEVRAVETIAKAKEALKGIEQVRAETVALPNKWVTAVNNMIGPSSAIAKKAKAMILKIETEIQAYRRRKREEAERLARKEQERLDRERERLRKKAEKEGIDPSEIPEIKVVAPKVETTVKTESGASSYVVKTRTFEVVDLKKLAKAALDGKVGMDVIMANEKVIRGLVNSGMENIPGVKITIKEDIRTRTS